MPEATVDIFDIADSLLDAKLDPEALDSRDLIKARDEAREEVSTVHDLSTLQPWEITEWREDRQRLAQLVSAIDEIERETGDEFPYGVHYIQSDKFVEYAQEFAEDIGAIETTPSNPQWPTQHIDWKAAADELKMDYTEIDIAGQSFLFRS